MNENNRRMWFVVMIFVAGLCLPGSSAWAFEDDEGCLNCHKYPLLGRVDDDGELKSYYVMPHVFGQTVHRNVPCRDCHSYIKEIPHKPVKTGVTCNSECHSIKNPATGRQFSHKAIYDAYSKSTHGRDKHEEGPSADKPYCINCHTNPLYNPNEAEPPKHITNRCVVCHESPKFAKRWYNHTSRRIKEVKRSGKEIIELCTNCHGDRDLVERHIKVAKEEGRELGRKFPFAAESYKNSFHGKLTSYGFTETANCLDCHAESEDYFRSVHEIRKSSDPKSPTHKDNKVKTCQKCHTHADENYVQLDPHPTSHPEDSPFTYYAEVIYNIIGDVVIVALVGISIFETLGRRRDGVAWRLLHGSSWRRRSRRGRDRVE